MPRMGMAAVCVFVLLSLAAAPAFAQSGGWTNDYNAAVRDAKAKNRPIVIDFGTVNCTWCRKLDEITFRDPSVAKRLAEQFVAVRLDADTVPALVQQLGISGYPTLVFAASDGKILGKHAGFVDVKRFHQQLDRALQESGVSSKGIDVATAPARPITPVVRAVSSDLPRVLLTQIRSDYQAKLYVSCLERCKELQAVDPTSADAAEAQRLAADIKNDPQKSHLVQAALLDAMGDLLLASAETAIRDGRLQEATAYLERIQQICPASPQALAAKNHDLKLRSKLSGQPMFGMQTP